MYSKYKYKFYLNINHAIYINGKLGETHPHTWEIILSVKSFNKDFVQFNEVEILINTILNKFQNTTINEMPPFDKINPTLENVCNYLNDIIGEKTKSMNIVLDMIEMCESPKRSFIIENDDNILYNEDIKEENALDNKNEKLINGILEKYIK